MILRKTVLATLVLTTLIICSGQALSADYVNEAKVYLEKGEFRAAIIQLKNQLRNKPKDAQARYLLGTAYLKSGQLSGAKKEFQRAYSLNPESPEYSLTYAQLLLRDKEYAKVDEILDTPFADKADEEQRQVYQASAYLGLGQREKARQIYTKIAAESANARAYMGLARLALLDKDMDSASQWTEKALAIDADNEAALQLKAKMYLADKQNDQALELYDRLINQNANNPTYYYERAVIYLALKQYDAAEQDIQRVLQEMNNQPLATYLLAQIRLQQKKYPEAQSLSQYVLSVLPRHYPSMLVLGVASLEQGFFNQAEKNIIQYLSINPNNIEVQHLLATIYLRQGNSGQAVLILEGIDAEQRAQNAEILTTLGSAYILQGEHEKGIELLNQAKALAPDSKLVQQRLMAGQFKSGDIDTAITNLENTLKSGKGNQQTNNLLILAYIQKKDIIKAEKLLRTLIEESPQDPQLYNFLAIVERLNGHNDRAKSVYQKILQLDKNFIPAYFGLAQLALEQNNFVSAKKYLTQVLNIEAKNTKAYLALAGIADKQNNLQDAEKYLLTGLEITSANQKARIAMASLLGRWYAENQQPQKQLLLAQQMIKSYPDDKDAMSFLARAEIADKKENEAEQTLRSIIKSNAKDSKHRLMLANLLSTQPGRETEVIKLIDEVIAISPADPQPLGIKVSYLIKIQRYQQAMDVADDMIERFPNQAIGLRLRGDVYLQQKDYEDALNYYQQAYNIQADTTLLLMIAEILLIQGQDDNAIQLLTEKLQTDSNNIQLHFKLGNIYQQKNQLDQAVSHYQSILKIKADHVLALNNLAWVYAMQGNPEAISLAKKAYMQAPDSSAIIDTYGYILLKQGSIEEGIKMLQKAVKLDPGSNDIQYHLAEGYYLNNETRQAKQILEGILGSNTGFSEKQKAINLWKKL